MTKKNLKGIEDLFSKLENSVNNCNKDVMETTYIIALQISSFRNIPAEYFDRIVDLSERFNKECNCTKKWEKMWFGRLFKG